MRNLGILVLVGMLAISLTGCGEGTPAETPADQMPQPPADGQKAPKGGKANNAMPPVGADGAAGI